jgi:hypothetical protein
MDKRTRGEFIDRLENSWQNIVERFDAFSPDEQAAYLAQQGYTRLADLLAHVVAWWQDGMKEISLMRADPRHPLCEYEVDEFNARAVERVRGVSPETMVQVFKTQRQAMVDLVNSLSEDELNQHNINMRLYYEIIQHWAEHELN